MPKSPLTGKPVKPGSNRTGIPSGPNAQKTGPKPTPIDWNQVGTLAGLHATQAEIAGYIGISVSQLTLRYEIEHEGETLGEFITSKRDSGKAKLRILQLESAKNGSVPMQIFLGKNWLGQSEKQELSGSITHAITHESLLAQIEARNKMLESGEIIDAETDTNPIESPTSP